VETVKFLFFLVCLANAFHQGSTVTFRSISDVSAPAVRPGMTSGWNSSEEPQMSATLSSPCLGLHSSLPQAVPLPRWPGHYVSSLWEVFVYLSLTTQFHSTKSCTYNLTLDGIYLNPQASATSPNHLNLQFHTLPVPSQVIHRPTNHLTHIYIQPSQRTIGWMTRSHQENLKIFNLTFVLCTWLCTCHFWYSFSCQHSNSVDVAGINWKCEVSYMYTMCLCFNTGHLKFIFFFILCTVTPVWIM
jgi:hypothetical protein